MNSDHGKKIKAYYYSDDDRPLRLNLIGRLKDDGHAWLAANTRMESQDVYIVKFDKFGERIWKIIGNLYD
jgi:hypothetical protein